MIYCLIISTYYFLLFYWNEEIFDFFTRTLTEEEKGKIILQIDMTLRNNWYRNLHAEFSFRKIELNTKIGNNWDM